MNKKNEPDWGSLGSGFAQDVPDEVSDFFGSEAPVAEPSVQWTAEQELAAQQAAQAAEAERAAKAERAAEAERAAAAKALAAQAQATQAQATQAQVGSAQANAGPVDGGRSAGMRPAARAAAPAGEKAKPEWGSQEAEPVQKAAKEPKTFGQTIRSHWDSLIDSLGIGGKPKVERARDPDDQEAEEPQPPKSRSSVPATGSAGSSRPRGTAAATAAAQEPAQPASAGRSAVTSRTKAAESQAPLPESKSVRGGAPRPAERPTAKPAAPVASTEVETTAAFQPTAADMPADAFGFGIFDPPSAAAPNPLDSLFVAADDADLPPEVSEVPKREPAGRQRDARRRKPEPEAANEPEFESREPRRRPPRAARPEPVLEEVADDEIEFEVVDLAGEDISDLWERPRRVTRSELPVEPPVEDGMPRHRGRPRPESSPPAAAGPRAAAPGPRAASRGEAPAPRTEAPASRATAPTSRAAAPTSRAAAPISRAAAPISRAAAGDPRPTAPSSRPAPGPRVRGEAPVVRPAIEDDLDEEREEPIAPRRRSRAARPRATEPLEPPTAGRESAGGRRRPAAERPEPARPGRPRDLDDDGYTVDNSWSPEDGPDPDAPRRRPVPAWRKVIDHIVDLNLGNRRGGDGHRRRGGSSPRGGASAGGGGRRADSPTDRPRPQRSNPPTYLDNPNPTEDFADYDEPGWETPAAEPQVPRGGGQRGRRGTGSDDYPPEDRPPGRGRRRY